MRDGVFLVVVGDDREDRPEDLFLGDRHVVRDVRRRPSAARSSPCPADLVEAAGHNLRALVDALLDVAAHALELRLGDQRPEAAGLLERVAGRERRGGLRGDLLDLGQLVARHEHARQRAAGLAGVLVALRDTVGDGLLEVGVVEDDVRGLAAELHRRRASPSARPAR